METLLRKDSDWELIEGQICRVVEFTPFATIQQGKFEAPAVPMPYASVELECPVFDHHVTAFISHKVDFANLWEASTQRKQSDDRELIIIRNKRGLKWFAKLLALFMPRLVVWVCKKGAYELITTDARPDLRGIARFEAERPLMEWKPPVMH